MTRHAVRSKLGHRRPAPGRLRISVAKPSSRSVKSLAHMADTHGMALTSAEALPSPLIARDASWDRGAYREVGAAVAVFLAYALRVVPAAGGRGGAALQIGLVSTVAAFVLTRAWRFLSPRTLVLLGVLPGCALAAAVLTPAGSTGVKAVMSYAYASSTFGFVAAFARTRARRIAIAAAVSALGIQQFAMALGPWLGGRDASHRIVGTFYWHNQFGAYMLAAAMVAGVLGIFGAGLLRTSGVLIAPVCAAMVLLSASRGSLLLLVAGWLAVGAVAAAQLQERAGALFRWGLMAVAVAGSVTVLTSPLCFPNAARSGSGISAVQRRGGEQAADSNAAFRVAHDRAALAVFRKHPLIGVGFDGYRTAGAPHLAPTVTGSPYVHNGYLQTAVDGGLLLAIPLLVALWAAIRAWPHAARRRWRSLSASPIEAACTAAALALLVHSAIDMDWMYPALVALLATLLAAARSVACGGSGDKCADI